MAEWRAITGYEGFYEASDAGDVRSLDRTVVNVDGKVRHLRGMVLRTTLNGGYPTVVLCANGTRSTCRVHSLVALTFIGPRQKGLDVAHWDGIKTNCAAGNLRYATRSQNNVDKARHGTENNGERNGSAKLTEADILTIRASDGRYAVLAARFGISVHHISDIRRRRAWEHI